MLELVLRVICRACSESGYCYLNNYVCFLLAYLNTGYFLTMKFKYDVKLKYEESEPNSWDPLQNLTSGTCLTNGPIL